MRDWCIKTARLKLTPATVALARAEIGNRVEFARQLGASVPDNWPAETAADALPLLLGWLEAVPDRVGRFCWYALTVEEGGPAPVLVAGGGFLGPPEGGLAAIGYSVLPQFQGDHASDQSCRRALRTQVTSRLPRHVEPPEALR